MFHHDSRSFYTFANLCRTLVPLVTVLSFLTTTSARQLDGNGQTSLDAAKELFERERDEEHRRRMRLVWSDEDDIPTPTAFEAVFMDVGYGGDSFLLLQCSKEAAKVSIAKTENHLDTVTFFTAKTTTDELFKLWRTMSFLQKLKVEEAIPHAGNAKSSLILFAHGSNHLVLWRDDTETGWNSRPILSSAGTSNGIRDLDELKTSAITSLVWGRFASEAWLPDSDRMAQVNWRSYWRDMLPDIYNPSKVDRESEHLIESACDMLCEIGEPSDADLLLALSSRIQIKKAAPESFSDAISAWRIEYIKKAIALSASRISLRRNWDNQVALVAIRNIGQSLGIELNQEKWLRETYYKKDPQGYNVSLLEDMKNPRARLVETSVKELATRYSGEHREEFHRLLEHTDPDVIFASAMALTGNFDKDRNQEAMSSLDARAEHDPLIRDALRALDRLASDSSISIRPEATGILDHARTRAINFLKDCPAPWGWDAERLSHQFEDPHEVDGRVIDNLLFEVRLPRLRITLETPVVLSKADRDRLISTWRRCLAAPYNSGTVLAIDELIALQDLESLSQLQKVVAELKSGCAQYRIEASNSELAFPWLTRADVDFLETKVSELAAPPEKP
jgi:hypothetical protein